MTSASSARSYRLTSTLFFFLVFGVMLYESGRLFWPYISAIGSAIVLAIVFRPWYHLLGRRFPRMSTTWRSLLMVLVVAILFIIPAILLIWSAVSEAQDLYPVLAAKFSHAGGWFRQSPTEMFPWLRKLPLSVLNQLDLRSAQAQTYLQESGQKLIAVLATAGTVAAKRIVTATVDVVIVLFCLFFMFKDGDKMYAEAVALIPLSKHAKTRFSQTMNRTVVGVVRGTLLMSLAQSVIMTLGLLIVRANAIVLLSCLTFAATLIPAVGTSLVTVPTAMYFFLTGAHWKAVFLLVWGTFVIGLSDNFLRPFLTGAVQEMSFFWVFFAILGGLEVFGLKGLLVGPLILALMPVFFEIYRERYLDIPED